MFFFWIDENRKIVLGMYHKEYLRSSCNNIHGIKEKTMKIFIIVLVYMINLIFCNAQDNSDPGPTCLGAGWYFQNNACQKCSAGYYCPGNDDKALQYACKEGTYQDMINRATCR